LPTQTLYHSLELLYQVAEHKTSCGKVKQLAHARRLAVCRRKSGP